MVCIPVFDNILFTKKINLNTFMTMIHCHQKKLVAKAILNIILFLFLFTIAGTASAQEMSLFSFGKGKIHVKLYSNYFCGACRNLEPKIEYLVVDLIKKDIITITFVDVASNRSSLLYAQYFLYILNDNKTIEHALKARTALFEASKIPIDNQDKLGSFLQMKGFKPKIFDTKAVFTILQNHIQGDRVSSTPTCIIINGDKKEVFIGDENILKGLENLR